MADVPEVTSSDPVETLAAGRRHLAVKDFPSAVASLGKACELLAAQYGDQADECGEAYLWYGKALLGLSREESGVLGDGLPGNEEAEDQDGEDDGDNANGNDDDNDEKSEDTNENKPAEKVKETSSSTEKAQVNGTTNNEEGDQSSKDVQPELTSSVDAGRGDMPENGADGDEHEEDVEEDEVENLQIAWETLELSRSILSKRVESANGAEASRALLAEAHLLLGEVALESETYDKAVIDMEKCLELQKELYNSEDRRIAETHYQIGLANSLASNFEQAVKHFEKATSILEGRIRSLEAPDAGANDPAVKRFAAADPFYSVAAEVKELKELLPEIKEKIQDMQEYKAETIKAVRAQLCPSTNGEGPSTSASSFSSAFEAPTFSAPSQPKQALDISHLIKRKRKSSQGDETAASDDTANPAKKPNP